MNLTLAVLLSCGIATGQVPSNIDLSSGQLAPWQGEGFVLIPATQGRPALLSSADRPEGNTGLLHNTFQLPHNAQAIEFRAAVVRSSGAAANQPLEVLLEGAGREYLPRQMWQDGKWVDAPILISTPEQVWRKYRWEVSSHAGRRVRLALFDQDGRPGCYLVCTGFRLITRDEINGQQFVRDMHKLATKHAFNPFRRYETSHFLALSNADEIYTEYRLQNCELIYSQFFRHFRKRGFELSEPREKLMAVIFDNHEGLSAYVGHSVPSAVVGLYHLPTNRLVVYDLNTNRDLLRWKEQIDKGYVYGKNDQDRINRRIKQSQIFRDIRDDASISTIMHEVAHQLSFNTGLLNRSSGYDVPLWLAEGLAVYCESTVRGNWQGIGAANPQQANQLARATFTTSGFLSLRQLISSDAWYKSTHTEQKLLGYAQSWALFRLLMEERPRQLRAYMQTIANRRSPEHRLSDFAEAFGSFKKLEDRYTAYLHELIRNESESKR